MYNLVLFRSLFLLLPLFLINFFITTVSALTLSSPPNTKTNTKEDTKVKNSSLNSKQKKIKKSDNQNKAKTSNQYLFQNNSVIK